jgi:hypothetical protein
MIEYVAIYEVGSEPRLCKKIVISGSDPIYTDIMISNKSELENISDELMYEHIENLVLHIKNLSESIAITPNNMSPTEAWPLNGWHDIAHINDDLTEWWSYVFYRPEPEDEEEEGSV